MIDLKVELAPPPEVVIDVNVEPEIVVTLNSNPIGIKGDPGQTGLSVYELAVQNGFIGTEVEWLASLKGLSAYEVAVINGFIGSEADWVSTIQSNNAVVEYLITTASSTWTINHNLGYYPNIRVLDLFNRVVIAEVEYRSINQVIIYFSSEQTGKVLVN